MKWLQIHKIYTVVSVNMCVHYLVEDRSKYGYNEWYKTPERLCMHISIK